MKTLQNNFTTPEQSGRLLELGVPADSADCYHNNFAGKPMPITFGTLFSDPRHQFDKNTLPCWTVGRLIEIFFKSSKYTYVLLYPQFNQIDFLMSLFEEKTKKHKLDFSKLEE